MRLAQLEEQFLTEKIKRKDREELIRVNQSQINRDRFSVTRKLFGSVKKIPKEEYLLQFEKFIHDKQ